MITFRPHTKLSLLLLIELLNAVSLIGQEVNEQDSVQVYKKRVLETTEVDILTSFYSQDGENAAVSGGIGTEELTDFTAAYVISVPMNDDDVLTLDAGISAYTSASSSNVNPFDGDFADPFQASTGASSGDLWANVTGSYSHSSDDRNKIWSANISVSNEYDYFSVGLGGSFSRLFNQKNTEVSIKGNVFIDTWKTIYPWELRENDEDGSIYDFDITGNPNYNPIFSPFADNGRNSYSVGLGFSQILHRNVQASAAFDVIQQQGLLSTPFQRVYFIDVEDSYVDNFHLADDVERLPDYRLKIALGGRLNWYVNERVVVRSFFRYYSDDWDIESITANVVVPIKISNKFTVYPAYRYYDQTSMKYFAPYNQHLSSDEFYTSDYDLSNYSANQFGFGVSYTDVFASMHVGKFGLKGIDVMYYHYDRNSSFQSSIITAGLKFVKD